MSGLGRGDGQPSPLVIKIGGDLLEDPTGVVGDVAHLVANGRRVVVVHGGSSAVDDLLETLGHPPEYVETPAGVTGRFTDSETMSALEMVLPGRVNTELVATLRNAGVNAVGVSGVDAGLITGPRKSAVRVVDDGTEKIKRGDYAGKPEQVNVGFLETLFHDDYVPVASPPMLADDGEPVNADADRVAAAVAGAINAEFVILTDVDGVYANREDSGTLIDDVRTPAELDRVRTGAQGFMTRKIMAATEALGAGATSVRIANGELRDPVIAALNGAGTRIERTALDTVGEPDP